MNSLRSPWHAGELAIQQHAGVVARMDAVGRRNVRDHMPEQHRAFFAQLPFVVLGVVDDAGDAWATLGAGEPGFIQSPDPKLLQIALTPDPADPAYRGFSAGNPLGVLGIELPTRRRNRMNGHIVRATHTRLDVAVSQSFGNCPQYILPRYLRFTRDAQVRGQAEPIENTTLDGRARALIGKARTFFVASYADAVEADGTADVLPENSSVLSTRQVDVSHRGGESGFVRVNDDGSLTIPDFAGNLFFNTLGNVFLNGRAGLVFVDFATGGLLQMTGDAEVLLDSADIATFPNAERLWRFVPRRVVFRADALPMRWEETATSALSWMPSRIKKIVDESTQVRSVYLEHLPQKHAAGQHLPIRVTIDGKPVARNYTLSSAPSDGFYRISVKRDGVVSTFLHDRLKVGDLVDTRAPSGRFTIDARERRPAVLLAAGIGVTPMLAMLRHVVAEGTRIEAVRPTWLFYASRSKDERAFDDELTGLAKEGQGKIKIVRVLSDGRSALPATDYDALGRIDMALLRSTLPFDDYDFYLCGPSAFMQTMYDGLRGLSVADERIHAESFGPSALRRVRTPVEVGETAADSVTDNQAVPSDVPVAVHFRASGKQATWSPQDGALLPFAEAQGLTPEFGCRGGSCGLCRTRVVEGAVAYSTPPSGDVAEGEALMCCAMPAKGSGVLVLDV
jgi:ferredoxin-NADP reductase/predicted pyridoxine 5'-phosphate oxidase superfamily flavin-nucleotide-binding protein/ferredoxin